MIKDQSFTHDITLMWNDLRKCSYEGVSNILQWYLHRCQKMSSLPFSGTTSISGICRKTNYHVIVTALFLYEIECKWFVNINISESWIRLRTEKRTIYKYKGENRRTNAPTIQISGTGICCSSGKTHTLRSMGKV